MIYLRKTTDIQEIWIPRLTPEKAEKKTCYENGYEDGYRDGVNTMDLQEKSVTSSTEVTAVVPDDGYTGMTRVSVNSKPYGDARYQEGYSSGSTDGYETGHKDGFEEGYGSGHTDGYAEGEEAGKDEILGNIGPVSVTVTADTMTVSPGENEYGFSRVDISAAEYGNSRYQDGYEGGHADGEEQGRSETIGALQDKDVEMTESRMTVLPDGDAPGLSRVDIDAFPYGQSMYQSGWSEGETGGRREMEEYVADNSVELTVTANGEYSAAIDGGAGYIRKVDVSVPTGSTIENQEKTVTITANTSTTVTYDEGYTGLESVDIQVNVPTGETVNNQTKTVTVTGNTQSVTYDSGYTGLESVEIDASDFGDDRYQDGYAGGHAEGYTEGYSSGETDGRNEIISGLEATAVTVTADTMTVFPAEGKHGFSKVDVNAAGYGNERYQDGYESGETAGKNEIMQGLEDTAVTVTADTMSITPAEGKYGFSKVDIDSTEYGNTKYQEGYEEGDASGYNEGYSAGSDDTLEEVASGSVEVTYTQNGAYDAEIDGTDGYIRKVTVSVPAPEMQEKSYTVTGDTGEVLPDSGYMGMSKVSVSAADYGQERYQEGYNTGNEAGYQSGYTSGHTDGENAVKSLITAIEIDANGNYEADPDAEDYLSFTGGSEYEISDFTSSSRKRIEVRFRVGENARAICNIFNDRKYTSVAGEDTAFYKSGTEDGKARMRVEMKNASKSYWSFTVPFGEWHTLVFDYAGKRYLLDGEEAYVFTGQVMGFDDNFLRLFNNPDVLTDYSLSGVDISHIYIWDDTEDGSGEPDYRFIPNPDRSGQWTDHVMTAPAVWGTDKNYGWSAVTVNVPTGDTINNQSKSLEITANTSMTVTYDSGYTGLERVDVTVNVTEPIQVLKMKDNPQLRLAYSTFSSIPDFIDFEGVVNMRNMFENCTSLTGVTLDTSSVTDMNYMFGDCTSLTGVTLTDTSKVKNMGYMFENCKILTGVTLDTSSVTDMNHMLRYCSAITEVTLTDTSKVENMEATFEYCTSLTGVTLDTSSVTKMNYMFTDCTSLTGVTLDTSSVTNISGMFRRCSALTEVTLTDTSKVTFFTAPFEGCTSLADLHIDALPNIDMRRTDLNDCPLSHDSIVGLLNALPQSTKGNSFQLGSTNIAKLTDDEKAIATNKGWKLI